MRAPRSANGQTTSAKRLRAVRPNAGIEALYRARIKKLIEEMARSVEHHVRVCYRQNPPRMAADAKMPARALRDAISSLRKRWLTRFEEAAPRLAQWFLQSVQTRSRRELMDILKDGGYTVRLMLTPAQRDIIQASVQENVALIRSIPEQYFTQIEGAVMRSVTTGRDLSQLSRNLQKHYGVSKRRAALISRDQNNKATSALTRARQQELGLNYAIWKHSHAGKEPRPAHVEMDGKRYDVRKGMWDKDEKAWIWPGQLINCRCTSSTIVPGLE